MHFAFTEKTTNWVIIIFLFQCFPHRTWSHVPPTFRTWQECLILCGQPLCSLCHDLGPLRNCKSFLSHHRQEGEWKGQETILSTHHNYIPLKKKKKKTEDSDESTVYFGSNQKPSVLPKKIYLKITPQTKLKNEYSHQLTSHTR